MDSCINPLLALLRPALNKKVSFIKIKAYLVESDSIKIKIDYMYFHFCFVNIRKILFTSFLLLLQRKIVQHLRYMRWTFVVFIIIGILSIPYVYLKQFINILQYNKFIKYAKSTFRHQEKVMEKVPFKT